MVAVLTDALGAPLTAIVFTLGLTHDVDTLLPILLAVTVSYDFVVLTMPRPTMTEEVACRGFHICREYTVDPFERHVMEEVMTRPTQTIGAQATLADTLADHFGVTQAH